MLSFLVYKLDCVQFLVTNFLGCLLVYFSFVLFERLWLRNPLFKLQENLFKVPLLKRREGFY